MDRMPCGDRLSIQFSLPLREDFPMMSWRTDSRAPQPDFRLLSLLQPGEAMHSEIHTSHSHLREPE